MNAILTTDTIVSKQSYFEFRKEWKLAYATQILEIRKARDEFKQSQREFNSNSSSQNYTKMLNLQRAYRVARNEATDLLYLRARSKVVAQQSYEAEHLVAA